MKRRVSRFAVVLFVVLAALIIAFVPHKWRELYAVPEATIAVAVVIVFAALVFAGTEYHSAMRKAAKRRAHARDRATAMPSR